MQGYSARQYVEIFHLIFLDQMGRKLDKKLYALKGGCNLRFYHNSIRYSEDIDVDVHIVAKETLRKKITQIFESQPFKQILRAYQIEILEISSPKQTETTQRWKIALKTPSALKLNTKIEFSRRGLEGDTVFERINSPLLQEYKLMPIMANHYSVDDAIKQKIDALIFRTQTQARDVFDLYHLITTAQFKMTKKGKNAHDRERACANALSVSFNDFKGQVVAFLPEDYQSQYRSSSVWQEMVNHVISFLREDPHEAH